MGVTNHINIVKRISEVLREVAPDALNILYGSVARNEASKDSDIDMLVVLPDSDERGSYATRKMSISGRLYDIELESGVTISPLIVLKSIWERMTTPFTLNVVKDGIRL